MKLYKLNQKAIDILVLRSSDELTARYFYEVAVSWCRLNGYDMAAEFFAKEALSEGEHFKRITDFLSDWNIQVPFPAIAAPAVTEFTDLLDLLSKAYQMEYDLLKAYEKDGISIFPDCQSTYKLIQEFLQIQNDSVIEYATLINKAENYLPTDSKLALFEAEVFEG